MRGNLASEKNTRLIAGCWKTFYGSTREEANKNWAWPDIVKKEKTLEDFSGI